MLERPLTTSGIEKCETLDQLLKLGRRLENEESVQFQGRDVVEISNYRKVDLKVLSDKIRELYQKEQHPGAGVHWQDNRH